MKKLYISLCVIFSILSSQSSLAEIGALFNASFASPSLNIKTTIPNHTYPAAGILLLTKGYHLTHIGTDCTLADDGYCLFSVNDTKTKKIGVSGPNGSLSFILCLNGEGPVSCQNYTIPFFNSRLFGVTGFDGSNPATLYNIDLTTGQSTLVMDFNDSSGGQSIASNGYTLYHWSMNGNLFEKINLVLLNTIVIPLSGTNSSEITGAVYHRNSNAFVTTSFESMFTNTIGGLVNFVGDNSESYIVRGMACYNHNIYGIMNNNSNPTKYILKMNPNTGQVISSVPITLAGFTVNRGFALTVDPNNGQFYAIIGVTADSIRRLVKINVNTGVATDPIDTSGGIGLRFSTIAFHPADPTC